MHFTIGLRWRAVKVGAEKNPVFHLKTGFFVWGTMKIGIWHKIGTWNLKTFLSISAGLHLLFLSGVAFLLPDFKIGQLPPLSIEVSLLPIVAQEKSISASILPPQVKMQTREEEKGPESPLPFQPETKATPMSDPPPENATLEIRNTDEERVEEEPLVQATNISLNPETVVTFQGDKGSESPTSPLRNISSSEEPMKLVNYPSPSEGEIIFIQPRYAENPKPPYPQEARKKGYQGEVVLKVEVLSSGQVGKIELKRSSGHEILDRSALAAVKQWRFIPARKGETAIPFWVNIPIKFQLQ